MSDIETLRKLNRTELAVSVANLVRQVVCGDEPWSLAKGRECVDVLLIATRVAFPTRADIESLGKDNTISQVAVDLSQDIQVMKEEAKNAPVV